MAEQGIDISAEVPKILTTDAVVDSDAVATMGCGDSCPFFPGKRNEDWALDDPGGLDVAAVRPIRDETRRRVLELLEDAIVTGAALFVLIATLGPVSGAHFNPLVAAVDTWFAGAARRDVRTGRSAWVAAAVAAYITGAC